MRQIKNVARSFLQWQLIGLTIAFILFTDLLKKYASSFNRFYLLWGWQDLFQTFAALAAVGVGIALVRLVVEFIFGKEINKSRAISLGFVVFVLSYLSKFDQYSRLGPFSHRLLSNPAETMSGYFLLRLQDFLKILLTVFPNFQLFVTFSVEILFPLVVGWLAFIWANQVRKTMGLFLLIISPTVFITFLTFLNFQIFPNQIGSPPAKLNDVKMDDAPNVYLIVFASMQADYVFNGDHVKPHLKTFRELGSNSFVIPYAQPVSSYTIHGLASLIGAPKVNPAHFGEGPGLVEDGSNPDFLSDNIFAAARPYGWKNFFVGSLIPTPYWIQKDVDYCWAGSKSKYTATNFFEGTGVTALWGVKSTALFCLKSFYPQVDFYYSKLRALNGVSLFRRVRSLFSFVVENAPGHSLIVVHAPTPSLDSFENLEALGTDEIRFKRNVVYADMFLNEIIQLIKKRGQWEKSLVIVSSDHGHGWNAISKDLPDLANQVPVFIKVPYPNRRVSSLHPFSTDRIKEIILTALQSSVNREEIVKKINKEL